MAFRSIVKSVSYTVLHAAHAFNYITRKKFPYYYSISKKSICNNRKFRALLFSLLKQLLVPASQGKEKKKSHKPVTATIILPSCTEPKYKVIGGSI